MVSKQRNAATLNELAKNGLEPSNTEVRQKYDEFKIDVTKQALKILKESIPAKILYFNDLVNVSACPGDLLHARDLEVTFSPEVCEASERKRSRLENGSESEQPVAPPLCSQIIKMGESVRRDALELIEMVGVVRLWIQLNVPRIEDGNNFGVAIQEEAIQELGRVEDAAFNLCDGIKYHMTRAKLISKVLKYPSIQDYAQSVLEVDRKEWIHLKVSLVDMRNSYCMLYDLLHKNWEKVVKPRTMDGNHLMVM